MCTVTSSRNRSSKSFCIKTGISEANKVLEAYDFESLAQNMEHDKHLISPQYRLKTVKVRTAVGHGMV